MEALGRTESLFCFRATRYSFFAARLAFDFVCRSEFVVAVLGACRNLGFRYLGANEARTANTANITKWHSKMTNGMAYWLRVMFSYGHHPGWSIFVV